MGAKMPSAYSHKMPFRFLSLFVLLLFYAKMDDCADKIVNWKVKYQKSEGTVVGLAIFITFEMAPEQNKRFELVYSESELDAHCAHCELDVQNEIDEEFIRAKNVWFTITLTTKGALQNEEDKADLRPLIRFFEFVVQSPNFEKFYTINLQNVDHSGHICKRIHFDRTKMPNRANFAVLFSKGFGPREAEATGEELIFIGHSPISPGQQTIEVQMAVDLRKQIKKYACTSKMQMEFYAFEEQLSERELQQSGNGDDECAICLAEFEGDERWLKIHRSEQQQAKPHLFHQLCIFKWFEKCRMCLSCRNEIEAIRGIALLPLLTSSVADGQQCQVLCENVFACLIEMAKNDDEHPQNAFKKRQAQIALDEITKFVDDLNREAIILFDLEQEMSYGARLIGMKNGQINRSANPCEGIAGANCTLTMRTMDTIQLMTESNIL